MRTRLSRRRVSPALTIAVALASTQAAARAAGITISNFRDGETVRYPVVLLEGTLGGAGGKKITATNDSSQRPTRSLDGLVHKGRFKVLAELVPGNNHIVFRAGAQKAGLSLTYRPQTNPYVVRIIYFTDRTGDTRYQTPFENDPQDFRAKLDTAMKILQCFTAQSLQRAGRGRRTFNLEFDPEGRVRVHVLRGDLPAERYRKMSGTQLYGRLAAELARKLPHPKAKNLVIPAFTRLNPQSGRPEGHTALGGGNLALFGGGDLFAWPSSLQDVQKVFMDPTPINPKEIFSDSVGRHTIWAVASTTIGAALHELGHTLALPHSRHPHDIMTRGHDRLNRFFTLVEPPHARRRSRYEFRDDEVARWAPVSAAALAATRHFAADDRPWDDTPTTSIQLDLPRRVVAIRSRAGIRYVGVYLFGPKIGTIASHHIPVPGEKGVVPRIEVPLADLGKKLGTENVALRVIDDQGLFTTARLPDLLRGPFVRSWRISPLIVPWGDKTKFPPLGPPRFERIVGSALQAEPVAAPGDFVDLAALAPDAQKANVAAYAVNRILAERPHKVRILTGSDDALRVWLNGKLVQSVLQLRSARPDAESAEAELKAGENILVLEVAQARGGWGFYLRLEDPATGKRLALERTGRLRPVDATDVEKARALLRGPFVRAWRFSPVTMPWRVKSRFVTLDAAARAGLEASAAAAPLVQATGNSPLVDFAPRFPPDKRANVAAYALRIIRSDRQRTITLHTGSDDALRIWLNGTLIQSVLALRGSVPGSESCEAPLQEGENRLLVEVSNGAGAWGLCLSLQDEDGAPLVIASDGSLVRLE